MVYIEVQHLHRLDFAHPSQLCHSLPAPHTGTHQYAHVPAGEFEHGQMTGKGYRRYLNTSSYAGCFSMGRL
jgi:hypothetical protein